MKLLTRYLFKDIIHYFLIFVSFLVVVLLINKTYDMRGDFFEHNPDLFVVIKFLLLSIPGQLAEALPIICLLSTIFAYGLQAKNREILAMIAAGVSYRSLAIPALVFGVGMTVFMFWFNESVVPRSQFESRKIERIEIQGRNELALTRRDNLFVKGKGNLFYIVNEYLSDTREMYYPTLIRVNDSGSGLAERIEAQHARLVDEGDNNDASRYWIFTGTERWTFDDNGEVNDYQKISGDFRLKMEDNLDKFLSRSKKPEEMNYSELKEYRDLLAEKGGEKLNRYSTSLYYKLAFPLSCLLMALLGFSVVSDVHARRFAQGVFTGLLTAIGYYLLSAFMMSMGESGAIAAILAGWGAIAVFAIVVYLLSIRLERIRG